MAEEKIPEPAALSPPSGGKLIPLLTMVNLLATLGMAAVLFLSFQRDGTKASVEDIAAHSAGGDHGSDAPAGAHGGAAGAKDAGGAKKLADFGRMITLDQFTVNLATPGSVSPKFVRVNVSIEVPTEDAESEVTQKMPQVRNAIIDLFNSKRPSDLATVEGRDYLKEEIRNAINGFMVTGKVKGVFFTNFALSS